MLKLENKELAPGLQSVLWQFSLSLPLDSSALLLFAEAQLLAHLQ